VDSDPTAIEKRDFPIARRGYSPAAVDAHLRAVAAEVEELRRTAGSQGADSLASSAGTQVRSIIEAAEAAAADIKNQARASAGTAQTDADLDAEATRAEAIARSEAHIAAVAEATAALLARIESLDEDLGALLESLRGGATRLARELAAVEASVGELREAAATAPGRIGGDRSAPTGDTGLKAAAETSEPTSAATPEPAGRASPTSKSAEGASSGGGRAPGTPPQPAPDTGVEPAAQRNGDRDGARLTALNMALSGEPREETDRYLAENFQLADREKLIAEVYAAIEG
jgi:DivIVA domain-containing protein